MSAFIVDKTHVDLLVQVAVEGPRGRGAVSPDTAWHSFSWYTRPTDRSWTIGQYQEHSRQIAHSDVDQVGAMLYRENVASVSYRYADSGHLEGLPGCIDQAGLHDDPDAYRFERQPYHLTIEEALQAVSCFEYQSCEHPGWPTSEAFQFCEALTAQLVSVLPGVRAAPWEWTAEKVAEARRAA